MLKNIRFKHIDFQYQPDMRQIYGKKTTCIGKVHQGPLSEGKSFRHSLATANVERAASFPNASPAHEKKAHPAGCRMSLQRSRRRWQPHRSRWRNAGRRHLVPAAGRLGHCRCNHVAVMTLFPASPDQNLPARNLPARIKSSRKDNRDMARRPSVTKHPFALMFVVIALMTPFAGLAWRTREWMGW
jgi:hypothetical protein